MPRIESFHLSDPGQTRANQDGAAGAFEPKNFLQVKQSGRLYVITDGLGSYQMGGKASAIAIETLLQDYFETSNDSPEKRLRDILRRVHQKLITNSSTNMMGGEKKVAAH